MLTRIILAILSIIIWPSSTSANASDVIKIYHDSDWSNSEESSEAIWRGMQVALYEVGYIVNGTRIELVKKNHGGNVTRSLRNLKDFLAEPDALVVVSGKHSPPLLTNRSFINENRIPTLVPWAAGGAITRYPSTENYVFRVSVDDTKAADVLVNYALKEYACHAPYLLLENTPWGDSNAESIALALDKRGLSAAGISRFNWNVKSHVARKIIEDLKREQAGCVILVSNHQEAALIAIAMSQTNTNSRTPIISHWGLSGGDFHEKVDSETRDKVDIHFIQTCFSFLETPLPPLPKSVLANLQSLYPDEIKVPSDIKSPVGFIHAYDLTKIFISALGAIDLTDDISSNRDLLKTSLENLSEPIFGLVKTYDKPFTIFNSNSPDAHEALNAEDICMASYGPNDEIIVNWRPNP